MANTNAIPVEAVMELIESAYMEGLCEYSGEFTHFQWLNSKSRHAFLTNIRAVCREEAKVETEQEHLIRVLADLSALSIRNKFKITKEMMEMVQQYLQEMIESADAKLESGAVFGNDNQDN